MTEQELEAAMLRGGSEFETPVLTSRDKTLEAVTQHTHSASVSSSTTYQAHNEKADVRCRSPL